ncbi:hypothetical protein ATK30_6384 [Amycolatopsis echigonensis]|uniref:Uncharacterized protein n=1 Tax=Amycolatopsis echigonensis TaxID=2576905 RepID=A0A2N3WNN7_9PSEU|nr:hypothetical protein ATK30_6384 [Amycolatopsis niigatensis]
MLCAGYGEESVESDPMDGQTRGDIEVFPRVCEGRRCGELAFLHVAAGVGDKLHGVGSADRSMARRTRSGEHRAFAAQGDLQTPELPTPSPGLWQRSTT